MSKYKVIIVMLLSSMMLLSSCGNKVEEEVAIEKTTEVTKTTESNVASEKTSEAKGENNTENIDSENNQETESKEEEKDKVEKGEANSSTSEVSDNQEKDVDKEVEDISPRVVAQPEEYERYKVNEAGHIMVVMYHGIKDNPPYHITEEAFYADLQYMYDNNYRLISMSDYINNNIDIDAGMTPIVFTFDDGLTSTFSLKEVEGQLEVDEHTAIGIMEAFAKDYPDFGKDATLYIHATEENFDGAGTFKERLQWLLDHDYEIGNHSATHANFGKIGEETLIKENGSVKAFLIDQGFDLPMNTLTYPFGARPDASLMWVIEGGTYNGVAYNHEVAFREGPSAIMYPPTDVRFSPYNAPRVRGSQGAVQDLWWFLNYYDQSNPSLKYRSDGNPETIVVPSDKESHLNEEVLEEKVIIVY